MATPTLRELIEHYLADGKLMQLATSVNGQPWVCSVWYGFDDDLNIYWFSAQTRRHSFEVVQNPLVAGAVGLPQAPDDPPRGLQFQGRAQVLTDKGDVLRARSHYTGRIFDEDRIEAFLHHVERPHRFYRIQPTQFVLFDAVNFPDDPRQQLDLD